MTASRWWVAALLLAIGVTGCCRRPRPPTPPATAPVDRAAQMVSDLAALRFDRLGDPAVPSACLPPVNATRERSNLLLVVVVEFADRVRELARSLGLSDPSARVEGTSNRARDVVAAPSSPGPQILSAWSRMMLGWLTPRVIVPPRFGGDRSGTLYLAALGDRPREGGAPLAAMVVLPPGRREIDLGEWPAANGARALYSGQGNRLDRSAVLAVDLTHLAAGSVELGFDAWWEIEGGRDFAYLETSTDEGKSWARRRPTDRRLMPAGHGHDGPDPAPGFTGLSGDVDGDGENESNPACDPRARPPIGEARVGAPRSPCLEPSWVKVRVDLSDLRGEVVLIRWRYVTDSATVRRGFLLDNVTVTGIDIPDGDFEGEVAGPWRLHGFVPRAGRFDVLVPRYYLLALRTPHPRIPYLGPSPDVITYCRVTAGGPVETGRREYRALPSGDLALPGSGFSFEVAAPGPDAPAGARAVLRFRWTGESR